MRRNFVVILILMLMMLAAAGCPENVVETDEDRPDIEPPQPVYGLKAQATSETVALSWVSPEELDDGINKDLEDVMIVRGENGFPNAVPVREDKYTIGDVIGGGIVIALIDPRFEEFVDINIEAGTTYYYEAFTFDEVPNYSQATQVAATPGSQVWGRISHTQTALADGRVLLAGGLGYGGPLDRAEIFDPDTETFTAVYEEMKFERFGHTATLLADGEVLLVGGYEAGFAQTLSKAELFDPDTQTFRRVASETDIGRALHTATQLPDGTVLITGGTDGVNALATLELYDPETETFQLLPHELWRERYGHNAAVVDQYVIVFGGFDGFTTVPYATSVRLGDFRVASLTNINYEETPMKAGRLNATANELPDGRWLIAGGFSGALESGVEVASAELFDFAGDPFFATTASLTQARSGHCSTDLGDGTVLIIGGIGPDDTILAGVEIYDPNDDLFVEVEPLITPRTVAKASVLPDGRVLVTGGNQSINLFQPEPAPTAEIFDPLTSGFTVVGAE
ncbi:MAG: kelch repeat-containing protein [Candidatus Lernaella stagnicola]|nr:kelch repeat-containing protein [Candidatus Lernaella stagnicola]